MAHRALVAYREGDRYRLHYAHWSDGLGDAITPWTPFGGPTPAEAAGVPAALADRLDVDVHHRYGAEARVDPRALATDCEPAAVLAAVDDSLDSVVVVGPDFTTRTFFVCSLGVDGGEPLVLAGPTDDPGALRQALVTAKERLGRRVDAGDLSAARARRALRATLARRVPVSPPDDASFLRTD
jgi:hypothetical protein